MIIRDWRLVETGGLRSPVRDAAGRARVAVSATLAVLAFLAAASPAAAQPIALGLNYLRSTQQPDGSWASPRVRSVQATAEALRAFQALSPGDLLARGNAAAYLAGSASADSDDGAHRLLALRGESLDVSALASGLAAAADPTGGWGLTETFAHAPLDTALSLAALAGRPEAGDETVRSALLRLLTSQQPDGGFPCLDPRTAETESEAWCTALGILGLQPYRDRYLLSPEIDAAVGFVVGLRNPDGSFGPPGSEQLLRSALASLTLAEVQALGPEVVSLSAFLVAQQHPDGSWDGDPFTTALALRAIEALSTVPFCGDGAVNRPAEACDGSVPAGLSCEGLGLGPGTLACSAQCTLDTTGCSAAPVCGDNLRNQAFEVCDGSDLAAQTCQSQGFAVGTLACAADCLSFNVSGCTAAPSCGDGVVNQPSEACDLSDLRGLTCTALGLGGGLLSCTSSCSLDTSQCDSTGFVIDNKGREFIVGFMPNPLGSATASVQLTSDVPTQVTVQYPVQTPSFAQTVSLTPGQVTVVNLPSASHSGWTAGRALNNAVRLAGPDDFVVYLSNRAPFTSDAGMALPIDALGTSYLVTTMRGSTIVSQDRSQFLVLAAFDNTTVTITPRASVRIPSPGSNVPAGTPFQVLLQRGQGFRAETVNSREDLTGSLIEADRPVAVLGGNLCTNVPSSTAFCDHIFEVMHPLRSWGTRALVTNLPNRPGGSLYRVLASQEGTQVLLDGVPVAGLSVGQFVELGPLAGNHVLEGTEPIFVTQFMTGSTSPGASLGDPAMVNIIPPDQFLESYTFSTVGGAQFRNHFLTVTTPDAAVGSVRLDGTPIAAGLFSPVGSSGYSSAVVTISEGSHTSSSPLPHGITVEGINQDDSYIYPGGSRLAFINQFCGDGLVNRQPEECDGNDFAGQSCGSFGFSSGQLLCTSDCRIDVSQCMGIGAEDQDGDGFPAVDDCNDLDPNVNPGHPEVPGNGIDDDCNPATPDSVPAAAAACSLVSQQVSYAVTEVVSLAGRVRNLDDQLSLAGLSVSLEVRDGTAAIVFSESRDLAVLPPGARRDENFTFPALGQAPGPYTAALRVAAAGSDLTLCSTSFAVDSSASLGNGLRGTLVLNPPVVDAGDPSVATYSVENLGNAAQPGLTLRIVLVEPATGGQVAELTDAASLAPGEAYTASQPFSTVNLVPRTYVALLIAVLPDSGLELTLASANLTVVNQPPVCTGASASPNRLWPPNHKLQPVAVLGVTDPDGDPVTVTVTAILQDEPSNAAGDGNTCPDGSGIGTGSPSVLAERQGSGDGRVYHLLFQASDGRGGTCTGEVTVCVPKSQGGSGAQCVDQGALYDSTVCP